MFLCLLPAGAFRSQICEVELGNNSASVEAIFYPRMKVKLITSTKCHHFCHLVTTGGV